VQVSSGWPFDVRGPNSTHQSCWCRHFWACPIMRHEVYYIHVDLQSLHPSLLPIAFSHSLNQPASLPINTPKPYPMKTYLRLALLSPDHAWQFIVRLLFCQTCHFSDWHTEWWTKRTWLSRSNKEILPSPYSQS
jgi:hypothetical protein